MRSATSEGVALVTGGSRGIGAAICLALAQAGWDVAVNYASRGEEARAVAQDIRGHGRRASVHAADVSAPDQVFRMVEAVDRELGPASVLVNNAGVIHALPTEQQSIEEWERTIAVDLTGPFLCIKAVLPGMLARSKGSIVNIASIAGLTGGNMGPAYAAAKGGLVALTRYLGRELIARGVRVNCVAPTLTDTEMVEALDPDLRERVLAAAPLRRLIRPEEVAQVVAFLASDRAGSVSGECVQVGGS